MKPITHEWLKAAWDDILVNEAIVNNELLSNMVAFHAQQAIEKTFKAVLEEKTENTPKSHDLLRLYKQVRQIRDFQFDIDMLRGVNEVYIDSRYPGDMGLLPNGKPSSEDANEFAIFARQIYDFVNRYLKMNV